MGAGSPLRGSDVPPCGKGHTYECHPGACSRDPSRRKLSSEEESPCPPAPSPLWRATGHAAPSKRRNGSPAPRPAPGQAKRGMAKSESGQVEGSPAAQAAELRRLMRRQMPLTGYGASSHRAFRAMAELSLLPTVRPPTSWAKSAGSHHEMRESQFGSLSNV